MVTSDAVEHAVLALDDAWRETAAAEALAAAATAAETAIDHDAEVIVCPACGHSFARGPQHCPDCELRILDIE